jgi:hypothetical protein
MSTATTFRLKRPDGSAAEPATFETMQLNWKPGDVIFLGRARTLRIVATRPVSDDDERVLVVEPDEAEPDVA